MSRPEPTIERLTTTADVEMFANQARASGRLALDTEFLWERTYAPVPCLVQVATVDRLAVIDPIEVETSPRSPSSLPILRSRC